jgi:hypothetical protein
MNVANSICHAVRVIGNLNPSVSNSHLLNKITPPLKPIHVLRDR